MKIGLVDADMLHRKKCTFPNLALMKISAYHKKLGDYVSWYEPLVSEKMDRVYVSKVFSDTYTPDIGFEPNAQEVFKGGSGYAITTDGGIEKYTHGVDHELPYEVAHIMPDYSLYEPFGIRDTAYGYITRGCPRGCDFCHVKHIDGCRTVDYSPLREFWHGQKFIKLMDPNIAASPRCKEYFQQLADTKSYVDFTQGIDIRFMTEDKLELLNRIKVKRVHFSWDNPKDDLMNLFRSGAKYFRYDRRKHSVYILTNFNSTFEQDVYMVESIKGLGLQPYVMIYNKPSAPNNLKRLARYANNPFVLES